MLLRISSGPCRKPAPRSGWRARARTDHRSCLPRALHRLDPPWAALQGPSPLASYPPLSKEADSWASQQSSWTLLQLELATVSSLITTGEFAEIKHIPHLQSRGLSLAKDCGNKCPLYQRCHPQKTVLQHEMVYSSQESLGPDREPLKQSERRLWWHFSLSLFCFSCLFNLLLLTASLYLSLSLTSRAFFSTLVTGGVGSAFSACAWGRAEPPPSNEGPSWPHCPHF